MIRTPVGLRRKTKRGSAIIENRNKYPMNHKWPVPTTVKARRGFPGSCKRKSQPSTLAAIAGTTNHIPNGTSKRFTLSERYALDVRRSSANLVAAPARTKSNGMIQTERKVWMVSTVKEGWVCLTLNWPDEKMTALCRAMTEKTAITRNQSTSYRLSILAGAVVCNGVAVCSSSIVFIGAISFWTCPGEFALAQLKSS